MTDVKVIAPLVNLKTLSYTPWATTIIDDEMFIATYSSSSYTIEVYNVNNFVLKRNFTVTGVTPSTYGSMGTNGVDLMVCNSLNQLVTIDKSTGAVISTRTTPTYALDKTATFNIDLEKDIIVYAKYSSATNNVIIQRYSDATILNTYSMPSVSSGAGASIYKSKYESYIIVATYTGSKIFASTDITNGFDNLTFKEIYSYTVALGGFGTFKNHLYFTSYADKKVSTLELTSLSLNKFLIIDDSGNCKSKVDKIDAKYTSTIIPKMTSNTAPSGVASASTNHSSYPAYSAFDTVFNSGGWLSLNGSKTGWLRYDFPTQKTITKYTITGNNLLRLPKDWTFEGSNDGINWSVLDIRIGISDWISLMTKEFTFLNTNSYTSYRINITLNNGDTGYVGMNQLEMMETIEYEKPAHVKYLLMSEQNIIYKGMDKSMTLNLVDEMKNKVFVEQSPTIIASGKLFSKKIDTSKIPIKNVKIL